MAEVPHSPHTDMIKQQEIYNPLEVDFTGHWDKKPYTIPAGKVGVFPEFLAYHLAKHLASKICLTNWENELQEKEKGQVHPDVDKRCPPERLEEFKKALLTGSKEKFEATEEAKKQGFVGQDIDEKPESSTKEEMLKKEAEKKEFEEWKKAKEAKKKKEVKKK